MMSTEYHSEQMNLQGTRRSNQSIQKEINHEYSLNTGKAEAPILWPLDAESQLTGKDPDTGKD